MPTTLNRTVKFGVVDSLVSATVGSWTSMARAGLDYWSGAVARSATPYELGRDFGSWMSTMVRRERPRWAHEHTVLKEWPIARLRDYSAPDADPSMVATILLPPQAGHDSSIVDYSPSQSQIMTARASGCDRVLTFDWVGATPETRDTTIDDYMQVMREAVALVGGKANLVGDCQGGWLATIFAALHPELVNSLTIAGAPVDFHAGEPLIHDWVQILAPQGDMSFYRNAVESNDGLLPGKFLLHGFMALQPDQELDRQLQLLANMHDPAHTERYRRFEDWFQWTQALPGEFYLWVVEHLFANNELIKGELVVEGRTVDLAAIDCPLFLMAGESDHITPPDQVWALADYASTPKEKVGRQAAKGGHLGLFMGRESLEKHWTVIFSEVAALSTPAKKTPTELTDQPSGRGETVVEPVAKTVAATKPASTKAATTKAAPARKPVARRAPARRTPAKAAPAAKTTPKTTAAKATAAKATPVQSAPVAKAAPAKPTAKTTTSARTTKAAPATKTVPAAKAAPARTTAAKSTTSTATTKAAAAKPAARTTAAKTTTSTRTTKAAPAKAAPATKTAAPAAMAAPAPVKNDAPATAEAKTDAKTAKTAKAPAKD